MRMRVGDRSASAPGRGGRRRRGINTRSMRYNPSIRGVVDLAVVVARLPVDSWVP